MGGNSADSSTESDYETAEEEDDWYILNNSCKLAYRIKHETLFQSNPPASGIPRRHCSSYIQTDDAGARHQGQNGVCTIICNESFA